MPGSYYISCCNFFVGQANLIGKSLFDIGETLRNEAPKHSCMLLKYKERSLDETQLYIYRRGAP